MRNKLIHEYFGADTEIIWNTVQKDLIQLEDVIRDILEYIRKNS
jgi:uncharacterized protein with HEPN domain